MESVMDPALTATPLPGQDDDPGLDWSPSELHVDPSALPPELQDPGLGADDDASGPAAMTNTTRRNANGSVSSVFSGNRVRYLKKDDGVPFWRKDIQYLFLRYVFEDDKPVFTKASDGTSGHTFADIYIDAMAQSSKCSNVLKDKLLKDREAAVHMAMICLLVNVGRMNTTLNFFPEMRARVRTYHAIPCLQAQQGSMAYKQLQDGPRLKSILKGAMEDVSQPHNLDELMLAPKPRTNPVNLIFVISQWAPKVSETHFPQSREFFDLFIRPNLSSRSRATAFLWLMWWYLESSFTAEDSQNNPFGPGTEGDDPSLPVRVPAFDTISDEDADRENEDTTEEIEYGESKGIEREAIVANDIPQPSGKKGQKLPGSEQQHNFRFRYSPYGSSGSESGSRGRPSPSPQRETRTGGTVQGQSRRRRRYDGGRTRSPTPPTPRRSKDPARIGAPLNDDSATEAQSQELTSSGQRGKRKRGGPTRRSRVSRPTARALASADTLVGRSSINSYDDNGEPQRGSRTSGILKTPNSDAPKRKRGAAAAAAAAADSPDLPAPSSRRSRNNANNTNNESTRRERAKRILHSHVNHLRKEKRRERRERGPLLDAWIKCHMIPHINASPYDSDEEPQPAGLGGIDEIYAQRKPAVLPGSTNVETTEDEKLTTNDGDAGAAAKQAARHLRRLARVLDGISMPKPRKRARVQEVGDRDDITTTGVVTATGEVIPSKRGSLVHESTATAPQSGQRSIRPGPTQSSTAPADSVVTAKPKRGQRVSGGRVRARARAAAAADSSNIKDEKERPKKRSSTGTKRTRKKAGAAAAAAALAATEDDAGEGTAYETTLEETMVEEGTSNIETQTEAIEHEEAGPASDVKAEELEDAPAEGESSSEMKEVIEV